MKPTASRTGKRMLAPVFFLYLVPVAFAESYPVAGVVPDQRPAGAPVLTEVEKGKQWYSQALVGIESPYPASLQFLEDQGNWFTPFLHPGMPGRYDLRQWYR